MTFWVFSTRASICRFKKRIEEGLSENGFQRLLEDAPKVRKYVTGSSCTAKPFQHSSACGAGKSQRAMAVSQQKAAGSCESKCKAAPQLQARHVN